MSFTTNRLSPWSWVLIGTAAAAVLLLVFLATPALPLLLSSPQLLRNASFEEGFSPQGSAVQWQAFDSGGGGWYIWENAGRRGQSWLGKGAQAIQLLPAEEARVSEAQYAGVCQPVRLTAGREYILSLRGRLIAPTAGRFIGPIRAQWGTAWGENATWRATAVWHDIPWPALQGDDSEPRWLPLVTSFIAPAEEGLICVRLLRRREFAQIPAVLYLDDASLRAYRRGALEEEPAVPFHVAVGVPSFVTAGSDAPVRITAAGKADVQAILMYEDDRLFTALDSPPAPLAQDLAIVWHPQTAGWHYLRVEAWGAGGRVAWAGQEVAVGEAAEFITAGSWRANGARGETFVIPIHGLTPGARYSLNLAAQVFMDQPFLAHDAGCLAQYGWVWGGDPSTSEAPVWRNMRFVPANREAEGTPLRAVAEDSLMAVAQDAAVLVRVVPRWGDTGACRLSLEAASLRGFR